MSVSFTATRKITVQDCERIIDNLRKDSEKAASIEFFQSLKEILETPGVIGEVSVTSCPETFRGLEQ